MNKNYFNDLNDRLAKATERLAGLNAEIYGPVPPSVGNDKAENLPCLTSMAELALTQINLIHDQLSSLENAIKDS
jgi:hypothetical protein